MEGELGMFTKVVITIPAYNEQHSIGVVIEDIKKAIGGLSDCYCTIVVYNDGSTDRTAEIAESHGAKVVSHKRNLGLARTFQDEIEYALGLGAHLIIHTDADNQYKAEHIPELISKLKDGYDLVLGSRFKGKYPETMPFANRWGNKLFAMVISHLTKTRLTDSTTGFRAFTRELAESITLINTFTYTQEQIIRAIKQGFSVTEVPINIRKTRKSRLFKSPLQYAYRAWVNLFRIYRDYDPIKFFGLIGGSFLGVGTLLSVFIIIRIMVTGWAGGTPRVVLAALLFLVGVQIVLFGFLADMMKINR